MNLQLGSPSSSSEGLYQYTRCIEDFASMELCGVKSRSASAALEIQVGSVFIKRPSMSSVLSRKREIHAKPEPERLWRSGSGFFIGLKDWIGG